MKFSDCHPERPLHAKGKCRPCYNRDKQRERRLDPAHLEQERLKEREAYAKNREIEIDKARQWRKNNPDYYRSYYLTNRDKKTASVKEYVARNPGRELLKYHKRRFRLKDGTSPGVDPKHWLAARERYSNCCVYCGEARSLTIDHVVPLAKGGRDEPSNIVPACKPCNSSKGAKLLAEWRGRLPRTSLLIER